MQALTARLAASLAALALLGFYAAAPASAQVSFTKAWGWGVIDGASQFETCTAICRGGLLGGGAGELTYPGGVAVDASGDVFVADAGDNRVAEYSPAGAFMKAWGWGVADGQNQLETCTTTCRGGSAGPGAGQLYVPEGVAVDGSGDVFVSDTGNNRVAEFSSAGAFIMAWGWGVADGQNQLETCTTTCLPGLKGGGAGQLNDAYGVAVDASGDVLVADSGNSRVAEFSSSGAFIRAWGWGVLDGQNHFETCTTTCEAGISSGGGAGEFDLPEGVAVDGSGDVFVADVLRSRVDEFSSSGAVVGAWGWGVLDGQNHFETCTTTCQSGIGGGGAGQLSQPDAIAIDGSGDVFVAENVNGRVDEFSSAGAFFLAWGWGVADGLSQFETCTTTCQAGLDGGAPGQLSGPKGVAVDGSDDVFDTGYNYRVDEFRASPIPQYTLAVSLAGTGSGSVTSGDGGIDCGATCSHSYASATMVTLTATPAAGSTFAGWSGAGCSGTGTCTVTISSDQAVTANFTTARSRPSCSISVASVDVLLKTTGKKGKRGTLRFEVRCDQSASVALAGKVTERVTRKHGKHRITTFKTFKVTTVRSRVTARATITLTVELPQAALTALAAGAPESALFTLTATNANGISKATVKVARLKPVKV